MLIMIQVVAVLKAFQLLYNFYITLYLDLIQTKFQKLS